MHLTRPILQRAWGMTLTCLPDSQNLVVTDFRQGSIIEQEICQQIIRMEDFMFRGALIVSINGFTDHDGIRFQLVNSMELTIQYRQPVLMV